MRKLVAFLVIGVLTSEARSQDIGDEAFGILEKGVRSGDQFVRARSVAAMAYVSQKDVMPYIRDWLSDPQWTVKAGAVRAMARLGLKEAEGKAEEFLKAPDFPFGSEAFKLLAAWPEEEAMRILTRVLLDPSAPARPELMKAVMAQGAKVIATVLREGLLRGDPWFVGRLREIPEEEREGVVLILAREKDPKVLLPVLEFARDEKVEVPVDTLRSLLKSKDERLKVVASEILALRGDGAGLKALLPLLSGPPEDQRRFLEACASVSSLPDDILQAVKGFLSDNTPEDLLTLAYLAAARGHDEDLKARLEQDILSTVPARRAAATRALARLKGNLALPKLYELLRDGNPTIRRLAAEGIGELGQAESVEVLERALRDTDRGVRLSVVRALGRIRDRSVASVAGFVVYDPDPEVRKAAILAVCNVRSPDAMPILRTNAENPDPEVRFAVIRAMIYLEPEVAKQYFEAAVAGLPAAKMIALAREFGEAFLPFMQIASESQRAETRLGALRAAREVAGREEAFLLEAVAKNPYPDVRREALRRLAQRSCDQGLQAARALRKDQDGEVRALAAEVLGHCGAEVEVLREMFSDPEELVRVAAAAAVLARLEAKPAPGKGKKKR